jgi:hypothetical protein
LNGELMMAERRIDSGKTRLLLDRAALKLQHAVLILSFPSRALCSSWLNVGSD